MYVQLYRSKILFYRKFGGLRRADCFKLLVRLAYWPRLIVASLLTPICSSLQDSAFTYRSLLVELHAM